jgi:CubicO group peptidase (beta-lactamase class C family)
MYDTAFLVGGGLLSHRATAYVAAGDGDSYARVLSEPSAYSGGGIYTTVVDLLKFDRALYGETLLNDANKKIMFTPVEPSPAYAYGWIVMPKGDTTAVWHSGGSGGFSSEFRRYPEIGLTVVVLSNYESAAYDLTNKIESMLLGLPYSLATEADMFFKRAMFLQQKEEFAKAIEILEKNLRGDEPHMPSLYQAARSRILGGFEQERALELLDHYIELAVESTQPSVAAAWWRKGLAYEQLGNRDSALACHRKSLELEPGFEMAQEALARLQGE